MTKVTSSQVHHIAQLANIPLNDSEEAQLAQDFSQTLDYITNLQQVDTSSVEPTHQVTGLENVWREDVVDTDSMYTQAQALANAPRTHQGYFVVEQVISK